MTRIRLLCIFSFLLNGCAFLINPKYTYTIKNNTPKDLSLKLFNKRELTRNVFIKSKASYDTTYVRGIGENLNTPFDEKKIDSIIVLFSDNKMINYSCKNVIISGNSFCKYPDKSPLMFESVKLKNLRMNDYRNFIIEESEYQNAIQL